MNYNKEIIKEQITIENIYDLLDYLDAAPQMFNNYIISRTICHNGDSHKLYYYENTQLFKCYSGECGTFDVFELIQKVEKAEDLNQAIYFVVNFFNLQNFAEEFDEQSNQQDWKIFDKYNKLDEITTDKQKITLNELPDLIKYYPQPIIYDWYKEGISKEVCDYMGIKYNPIEGSILIPHYNEYHKLIGIRQRTLVKEQEVWGKYRPARIQGKLCNHPLAFNLYGLDRAKENISKSGVAIVVEGEKSVLQYMSYFGTRNNLCVAVCGSSLSKYQFNLLLEYGAKEIAIGFDKDFQELGSDEFNQVVRKLENIYKKYISFVNISFLFDKYNLLGYKNSPLDCGKDAFLYLWKNRIVL